MKENVDDSVAEISQDIGVLLTLQALTRRLTEVERAEMLKELKTAAHKVAESNIDVTNSVLKTLNVIFTPPESGA